MLRVAVIEDEESMNKHLVQLISGYDVHVVQAFTREQALQLVKAQRFDIVIVDVDLGPGPKEKYAGLEILSLLNGTPTVTLVVSGAPHPNLQELAISLQAYDFIGKPIPELSFINKFEHALKTAQMQEGDNIVSLGSEISLPPNLTKDPKIQYGLRWKGTLVRGLTLTHLRLVACLIEKPGTPVKRAELANQLVTSNAATAIATHMSEIRKQFVEIDPEFSHIQPEPGVGYVWKIEPQQ
jgi:DNA-binding response OmpR family regulator